MLRSAVVRECEVVGEALSCLAHVAPERAARIPDFQRAIAFRNLLIHGYATVDDAIVWRTVHDDLPRLAHHVAQLLAELGAAR